MLSTHVSLFILDNLFVLQSPFAIEWVEKCVNILTEDFGKINPKITSFMLNFCSLMVQNEWIMIIVRERHIMDKYVSGVLYDSLQ